MARRRGNGSAVWALLLTGGAWAWQNRDQIRQWAESKPEVRSKVDQFAQQNPQVRNFLEKQVGWQTQQRGTNYGNGGYTGGSFTNTTSTPPTTNTNTGYPVTGETRRIGPVDDTNQDGRGSGI